MATHTRFPIYRITFAPGSTLAMVNHVWFIENLKIYWEKYESNEPAIQCYRCQAHGHYVRVNRNKTAKCVKCAGPHDTRNCTKTADTPPMCVNCKGVHPANYSKCPAFLVKRNTHKMQLKPTYHSFSTPQHKLFSDSARCHFKHLLHPPPNLTSLMENSKSTPRT